MLCIVNKFPVGTFSRLSGKNVFLFSNLLISDFFCLLFICVIAKAVEICGLSMGLNIMGLNIIMGCNMNISLFCHSEAKGSIAIIYTWVLYNTTINRCGPMIIKHNDTSLLTLTPNSGDFFLSKQKQTKKGQKKKLPEIVQ
uniref:Uncharacterized protein n=1 Tax=Cacopsylla melanoneura TaxID=428564 RepID=A0A8D8XZP7_9HEMI